VVRRLYRITEAAIALYGLGVLLTMYSPIADYLVHPLWVPPDRRPAQAIVVLTAWASAEGVLNEQAIRRTHAAARLYRDGLSPLMIISGGAPEATKERPAVYMADFAKELGVPDSAILLEEESRNTHESAVRVAAICRRLGIRRVLLVTDVFHMRRAIASFRAQGIDVSPIPADPWALDWEGPIIRLHKLSEAVHEYVGLIYYRAMGWT